jgi:hypothetical protein
VEVVVVVVVVVVSRDRDSFYWDHIGRFYLKTETKSSLRNVVLLNKREEDG